MFTIRFNKTVERWIRARLLQVFGPILVKRCCGFLLHFTSCCVVKVLEIHPDARFARKNLLIFSSRGKVITGAPTSVWQPTTCYISRFIQNSKCWSTLHATDTPDTALFISHNAKNQTTAVLDQSDNESGTWRTQNISTFQGTVITGIIVLFICILYICISMYSCFVHSVVW